MYISLSNIMATSVWTAFLSVLAIIGIIVAGGFIVALLGRMVLNVVTPNNGYNEAVAKVDEFGYEKASDTQTTTYLMQDEELKQSKSVKQEVETVPVTEDYLYGSDVDDDKAKLEEEQLNKELSDGEEDDFFKDFAGDEDVRFGEDDDLLGMIDEISQDVLDEEEQKIVKAEEEQTKENQSMLDKYSIDSYLQEDQKEVSDIFDIIDVDIVNQMNELKQQANEIVNKMKKENEGMTYNEQLISILNELKQANNKAPIETIEQAELEINLLSARIEDTRIDMETQVVDEMFDMSETKQDELQEQIDETNAEVEAIKQKLEDLIDRIEKPEAQEVEITEETSEEKVESQDEIAMLRNEVKEMMDTMRAERDTRNDEFNARVIEILNEMKEVTLNQSKNSKIETSEDAVAEVESWQEDLELTEEEMNKQFSEQMLHKSEEEKAEIKAQMESYNAEIAELKEQLAFLISKFQAEGDESKAKNQALLDQLEAERQQRINLENEKLATEKAQQEQLERLRKENEELADKLQARQAGIYETLTEDELADLYSETTDIDYSAISRMNEDKIDEKVKEGLKDSKQDIDELKEQVSRLTTYIEEREGTLAEQINVHEVRTADFDIEKIKEITAQEVENKVREKLIDSLAEIQILKEDLANTKEEIEKQYKDQLANTDAGMEYDRINQLQTSAEKIDVLNIKLEELTQVLIEEQNNVQDTTEECVAEFESARETKTEQAKKNLEDEEVAVIGPSNNTVALVAKDETRTEVISNIDEEMVKRLTSAEMDEIVEARLEDSNKEIESLKQQIEQLRKDLDAKDEQIEKATTTSVPVVRSPLFDVEAIKRITAQEVEAKVQERLAEAMKEIESMKQQLELSKKEIERQYKEQITINKGAENEVKEKLKDSAAEVIELKGQLSDLTEQITMEHEEARLNSESIAEQLEQDRKDKLDMAKQLMFTQEGMEVVVSQTELTVIGPKDNQVALVTGASAITEGVNDMNNDIPTIDIETVKRLTEEEIEEKVQQRMASSIIEIEELKKQILNLSIQIQEIKGAPAGDDDSKPMVFHYATEEAYLERIAILEERLKAAKKDLKINNKELGPLEKVNRTLERDKLKLRRKYAIAAKKKVSLYGVNNYVDLDKEKAEKLKQELELLEGLKLSVSHCEEVMNANIDRYPILVHTDKILRENIANIESDLEGLNKELKALREKNGSSEN